MYTTEESGKRGRSMGKDRWFCNISIFC